MDSSSNSRQAMWVAIGQFCSFFVAFISPMILSRYFNKTDYGTYKQVIYVYNTLLSVFTLGLPRAYSYFIPRVSIGQSKDVISKITNLFVILGFVFSILLFFGAGYVSVWLKNPDLEQALKWFAPTPLFMLPIMGLDSILASYKKTEYLALYTVLTKLFMLLCIVLPVLLFNGTYIHAIIGFDISSLLTFILALHLRNLPTKTIKREKARVTYKEIFQFALPLFTASIWIMVFQSANQFFISRYYGTDEFAEYSNGFTELPLLPMIVQSVAIVLLPVFSGLVQNNKEEIGKVWMSALSKTVKLIYPMAVYCIMFASLLMVCMYGRQYENSGRYFIIRNFEAFFSVIPFYPILLALGKTKNYSNIHLLFAIVIIPLEYFVVKMRWSAYMVAIMYLICSIGKVIMQFQVVGRSVNMSIMELIPIRVMCKAAFVSTLSGVLPLLLVNSLPEWNPFVLLFLSIVLFISCYYVFCWILHLSYKDIIISYLDRNKFAPLIRFVP